MSVLNGFYKARFLNARLLTLLLAGVPLTAQAQTINSGNWSTVQPILARNVSTMNAPAQQTPGVNVTSDGLYVPDGAFMGNGDVTVAIGGTAAAQMYTITTTDFYYTYLPVVVGSVTVNTPGFDSGAMYLQKIDPGLGEVRSTFTEGSQALNIRSIVSATSNVMVVQFTNTGSATISGITIVNQAGSVGTNYSLPITDGVSGSTAYITRTTNYNNNPWVASVAIASRVVDGTSTATVVNSSSTSTSFSVAAGATVSVVVGIAGGHNATTFVNDAVTLANNQSDSSISSLITAHEAWWQTFWTSGATVNLGGGPAEQYWYTSLYYLACFNRAGQMMGGMEGIQTEDYNAWHGFWGNDYNIENPYLGVFSANHPELTTPYFLGMNQYLPTAYSIAGSSSGANGGFVYNVTGPGGQNGVTTSYGLNGNMAWLGTVYVDKWNYTRDATWASQTGYPWLVAAAHWWDQHLVYSNGVYNDNGSAQNEGSSYQQNAIGDLANLRGMYAALIDMNAAGAVTSSASDLALWKQELANLAPLPTFTYNGHTDFKATQDAPGFYGGDANPVNPAVWAPVLGLGSDPASLLALQNTIYDLGSNSNIWYQGNSFAWAYPAAARAGLPDIYRRLNTALVGGPSGTYALMRPNGTVAQNGGGAETMGNVETVNEMLLSSYDGVLRLFPAWPLARNVSYSSMGAVGGFSVSGAVTGGVIQPLTVVSNAGHSLTVAQPWPGVTVNITDASSGVVGASGSTATVTASTTAGHTYNVTFSGVSQPAVNLATQATPSVSSEIGSTSWWAYYANDGQTQSYPTTDGWSSSANLQNQHAEWYQLDLGTAMAFNEVDLWPRSDAGNVGQGFPSSYNIAVSNDGSTFTTVATGSATTAPSGVVAISFASQNARYVRVNGLMLTQNPNDSNQYRMQLAEVQIFNRPSAPGWPTVQPILNRSISTLTSSPTRTPGVNVTGNGLNVPDGPFMGNGDVTVAVGGTAASQTYTINTTDFFYTSFPVVVGSVTVNTPGFDGGASYQQQNDPALAEVRSAFTEGSQGLKIRSIVSATSNVMVLQLTNTGSSTISGISVVNQGGSVGTNYNLPITDGVSGSTAYITRSTNYNNNPWVASVALATRVVDGTSTVAVVNSSSTSNTFSIAAGATVNVVVGVGGGHNSTTYMNDAVTLANNQTDSTISSLITAHENWWQTFWTSGATLDLGGVPTEKYWYTSLYYLACFNRAGQQLAGMQGIQTEDQPAWNGWWTTDYNIENPYLGVFSASHPELAAPYFTGISQYLQAAYALAGSSSGANGGLASNNMGPGGQNVNNGVTFGMNGNMAWLATVYVNKWNYSRDATWASQVGYPWLVATAHWWDQHLAYTNGVYNDNGSAQNEGSSYQQNAIGDLANLRGLYAALIDMNVAGAVTSSSSDLSLWKQELANLAPLPTFTNNGHTDFKATQDAPGFYGGDANPVNPAVWSPVLGLGSSVAQLQALQNTVYDLGVWFQGNSFAWIYPAMARAGLPDSYPRFNVFLSGGAQTWGNLRSNGTVSQDGGGAETMGSMETVNEMLLSSYDGVLRLFPAWPLGRNATYTNMGAIGGFSVSGAVTGGVIQPMTVVSNAGHSLTIAQPWAGATVNITDMATGATVSGTTATVTASTTVGHPYNVTFSGAAQPAANLATQAILAVSSEIGNSSWWAYYANDGQTQSYAGTDGWSSSANLQSQHTEWYQLDLGSATAFNEVDLWPRSDAGNVGQGFPSSFNVAVSNDGSTFTTAATGSVTTAPSGCVTVSLGAQNARYVRVNGLTLTQNPNDGNQYRMQLAEVQIFNRH